MDLSIARSEHHEVVVLACTGSLGAETSDDLARAVAEELRRGFPSIRLDLTATTFLSSAGIRSLFEIQRSTKSAGGNCFIRQASAVVKRVLDLTRLAPILMEPSAGDESPQSAHATGAKVLPAEEKRAAPDIVAGGVRLISLESASTGLQGRLIGSPAEALTGNVQRAREVRLERGHCGLGLAALADGRPVAERAGEWAAIAGAAFHRPPQPHVAIDYILPTAELVADVRVAAGLVWDGIPGGRAGYEPAGEEPFVRLDELFEALLGQTDAGTIAVVVAGEVHGLVGVELIRPLAEAGTTSSPLSGVRNETASWLSFSREPVFSRQTALIVGVVSRHDTAGAAAPFLRPVPDRGFASHCHAVVFPFRPLRRGGLDLAATVADLAAAAPLAVLHLVADPQPVLGSGRSELCRGSVWFAPLSVSEDERTA